jgi:hypothetical protein
MDVFINFLKFLKIEADLPISSPNLFSDLIRFEIIAHQFQ